MSLWEPDLQGIEHLSDLWVDPADDLPVHMQPRCLMVVEDSDGERRIVFGGYHSELGGWRVADAEGHLHFLHPDLTLIAWMEGPDLPGWPRSATGP